MSDETIVRHCSPTLAGIKTGSMFSVSCESQSDMETQIREYNRMLVPKGLVMLPLRFMKGRVLIYLFRPEYLKKDLSREESLKILSSFGYSLSDLGSALKQLILRMEKGDSFPHEIGLFLGYPPEDVKGFIENGAEKYQFSGIWKVYGNAEDAKKMFGRIHHCETAYMNSFHTGMPLEKLAVKKAPKSAKNRTNDQISGDCCGYRK